LIPLPCESIWFIFNLAGKGDYQARESPAFLCAVFIGLRTGSQPECLTISALLVTKRETEAGGGKDILKSSHLLAVEMGYETRIKKYFHPLYYSFIHVCVTYFDHVYPCFTLFFHPPCLLLVPTPKQPAFIHF
jgi:hypothetical protein